MAGRRRGVRLRTINRVLGVLGLVLVLEFDEQDETGVTRFRIEIKGLRGTARRRAWDAKWIRGAA